MQPGNALFRETGNLSSAAVALAESRQEIVRAAAISVYTKMTYMTPRPLIRAFAYTSTPQPGAILKAGLQLGLFTAWQYFCQVAATVTRILVSNLIPAVEPDCLCGMRTDLYSNHYLQMQFSNCH